jgi:hypothetical protein
MRLRTCSSRTIALLILWILLAVVFPAAVPAASQSEAKSTIYLPLVLSADPAAQPTPSSTVFGMVMGSISPERGLDDVIAAGATWIRSDNNLLWREVEPVEGGDYQWNTPAIQRLEQEMILASQRNLKLILIVRGSPRWATVPYKADCAPIQPSKYARFAAFLAAAVARYSKPPYNVVYWQIGNEPDAYIFSHDSGYGCWGVKSDPYYGGRAYGEMLKVVYPAIKAANPDVQVLHGSLLLDRPYNPKTGSGLSARFLEGVFLAGAADSFDILPFNAYFWSLSTQDWKTSYLRNLQAAYNVGPKPMIITEQALLCDPACPQLQAYAVGRYYTRALSYNLLGTLWYIYDADGFHHTALVEPTDVSQLRPAYWAYRQVATQLKDMDYTGPLQGQPSGVEGYRFVGPDRALVVLWSSKAQQVVVPVAPSATVTCAAWDGAPLPCTNATGAVTLTADLGPVYVVTR